MSLYSFGKPIVSGLFKLFFRYKVIGEENVPKDGGVLLCSNHLSNFDPPMIGCACPRELSFMAKAELFKIPLLKQLITRLNAIPVKRGHSDRQAFKMTMKLLEEGKTMTIFPEGTRNKTDQLKKGLSGAGFFALRTNAHVVPCAIIGSYKLFKPIKVVFGEPIDFSELKSRKAKPAEATEIIMTHIQALIDQHKS
ncbi:1-acyl-sn-glycerol-3-phosphate acyltransferase [Scopulibacillus daqui]|uniref:1-acyl-sn-glycerol-3-phosphate acyltransferase n=1 Tax=Scopulibacillus daqui TaxID=1469162 RepID=A0ABS2PZC1_9BACL|nr:1-acyl-sn-glycerol-3-phosphate acyltransferase [Scopulibacillus daqui]